ncbi:MAG: hypothetical protein QMD11_04645, partial [Smithella sp.]|nr:hypothetical protein [Smithella sp.]
LKAAISPSDSKTNQNLFIFSSLNQRVYILPLFQGNGCYPSKATSSLMVFVIGGKLPIRSTVLMRLAHII